MLYKQNKKMETNPNHPAQPDPARSSEPGFNNQDPLSLHTGLTKREYFAAMAMQGRVANEYHSPEKDFLGMAFDCVKCADALIEALNK